MTGLKRAVTLAQQNREREVNRVRHDQVRLAVAVEVAGREWSGTGARGVIHATGLELDNKTKTVKFKSRLSGQMQPQNNSR